MDNTSAPHDIDVRSIRVRYGRALALDGVSLVAERGKVTAVIGANGAGKSTLLKAVMGLVPVSDGSVHVQGRETTNLETKTIVAGGTALVPEGRRLFGDLTVEENLKVGGYRHRKLGESTLGEVLALFPELEPKLRIRAEHLSGGQQQMVAIGRALMSRPDILLLDEPCAGLAPIVVQRIAGLFGQIAESGTTVVLIEQNATVALDVSHHCYVLETGKVVLDGSSGELRNNDFVSHAYLGI